MRLFLVLQFFVSSLLIGCASVPSHSQQSSFADYAEGVFRQQNALSSRLMMLSDADLITDNELVDKGEERMRDACHLLNEYAEREHDGENIGWTFSAQVQDSIENCDRSIQAMEQVLQQFEAQLPSSLKP